MSSLIFTYTTPVDPGGGNPQRTYVSIALPTGWTALSLQVQTDAIHAWSGSGRIIPGQNTVVFFNQLLANNSQFTFNDPNQAYVTTAGDSLEITCNNGGAGAVLSVQLYGIQTGPCSAGSEPQAGAPAFFNYDAADIAAVLPYPIGIILWGLMGIPSTPQSTADFCSKPPPTEFPVSGDYVLLALPPAAVYAGTYRRFANQVFADKWGTLCQCIPPGAYTPPGPPSPPAGFPTLPGGPTCASDQDICNALWTIQQTLAYILQLQTTAQPAQLRSLAEFTTHSNLTGDGTIVLGPGTLGVRVSLTTDNPALGSSAGDPLYLFDRGYIVPFTSEGPQREFTRLTYNPQLFMLPTLTTQVGYHFNPSVVGSITEITAGP